MKSACPYLSLDAALINVDLRFESATGFGKWRLLCSHSCLRFLAQENEQSHLAQEKLRYALTAWLQSKVANVMHRELSFGNFSGTNQERITRNSPVDIFRARLPGDIRLVVSDFLVLKLNALLKL